VSARYSENRSICHKIVNKTIEKNRRRKKNKEVTRRCSFSVKIVPGPKREARAS